MSNSLISILTAIVSDAFVAEGLDASLGKVQVADRPDLAQFQCNGAMAAAGAAKKLGETDKSKTNPRAIGEAVAARLESVESIEEVSLAGPGFINLKLTDEMISGFADDLTGDARAGAWQKPQEKIIIDYGGANVAKPLHVGHLRAAIIGESLKRLMRLAGDDVTGDVHLGDWGKQMGQLICQVEIEHPDLPYFDEGFDGAYPEQSPVTLADLEVIYPKASAACKADPDRDQAARIATAALQAGRAGYRALWQHFVDVSRVGLEEGYGGLGVTFDLWKGESDADPFIKPLEKIVRDKGLLENSEGAEVIQIARENDKKEIPPLIFYSRDGSVMYGTTDMATIFDRVETFNPDHIIYVVDQRQAQHFEQVFRAVDKAGLITEDKLEHQGFGTINGPDDKPYKTREGDALPLQVLLDQTRVAAKERVSESLDGKGFTENEIKDITAKVGMAALKFADLSNPRTTNYIFDVDRFLSFEGKTGPYLLYAAVRIKSVLEKAGDTLDGANAPIVISTDAERDLILALGGFADAMQNAYHKRMPHIMCDHAYSVAQAFSKFYTNCRISDEADESLKQSRITLARLASRQLCLVLEVLGIDVPERM